MTTLNNIMENKKQVREIIEAGKFSNPKLFSMLESEATDGEENIEILVTPEKEASYLTMVQIERKLEQLLGKKVELTSSGGLSAIQRQCIQKDLIDI